ncbi:zonular occludens toxin domain-containing protein [Clostridioides difficile]|nr:zonular occludens toxin domain-containing protein [Clostridioides difficile]
MIYFYSGTNGSGKSLHTARIIYNRLFVQKKDVIANFCINMNVYHSKSKKGKFFYVNNRDISPQLLKDYAKKFHIANKESQTLVVLDECSIKFSPRRFNDKDRLDWLEFFDQHRHFGYDFILISLKDRKIDRQIRDILEYDVVHRKANRFKILKFFPFPVFIAVYNWYGVNVKDHVEFFTYRKRYGKFYDTFKDFNDLDEQGSILLDLVYSNDNLENNS